MFENKLLMEKILVISNGTKLAFQLSDKKIKSFDVDDFIHYGSPLLPCEDCFINIEVRRNEKVIDVLRTNAKKDKYPGDTGEMMFCGLMANSQIIKNWRKKNPHFLGITDLSSGVSADMFEENDEITIEHNFGSSLMEIAAKSKLFI